MVSYWLHRKATLCLWSWPRNKPLLVTFMRYVFATPLLAPSTFWYKLSKRYFPPTLLPRKANETFHRGGASIESIINSPITILTYRMSHHILPLPLKFSGRAVIDILQYLMGKNKNTSEIRLFTNPVHFK